MDPDIHALVGRQREFFSSGATRRREVRAEKLETLIALCRNHEAEIIEAIREDLGRNPFEAYLSEVGTVIWEAAYTRRKLRSWMRPGRVRSSPALFPSSARVAPEPLGCSLIIGPWNYPVHLVLKPLIAAIAAGNCCIIKPGELAPRSSQALARLIRRYFEPEYVAVVEGGAETADALLEEAFDHIFFTGSSRVGRIVMEKAARRLTPVVLELGGSNPCIVDATADIAVTARRIVWAKYFNAGQTCLAPGFLVVHRSIRKRLDDAIIETIRDYYGDNPKSSPGYARIINSGHTERLGALLEGADVIYGGDFDVHNRYVAPTIVSGIGWKSTLIEEEILGPVLPVLEYDTIEEVVDRLISRPKPPALYLFTRSRRVRRVITRSTSSGAVLINDAMVHAASHTMPFGGVGESGFGRYHGKSGFDAFSNPKTVLKRRFVFDWKMRYPPYSPRLTGLFQTRRDGSARSGIFGRILRWMLRRC